MSDTQYFSVHSFYHEEPVQLEFLPNLAERQETLRRANAALERARLLLEHVRQLDLSRGGKLHTRTGDTEEDAELPGLSPDA